MKKFLLTLLGVIVSFQVFARDFSFTIGGQTLTYTVLDEDAKTCSTKNGDPQTAGNNVTGEIFIPSKANDGNADYSVIAIGDYSFANQKDLYYIELSEGLLEIGNHAFDGCEIMTFESFPSTLVSIGEYAFSNCITQKSLILPASLISLGKGSFNMMTALEKAVLLSEVQELSDSLCFGCRSLSTLYLPRNLKMIGNSAFEATSLEQVNLPEGIESIGDYAFARGDGTGLNVPITPGQLRDINFPKSLRTIGNYAFYNQYLKSVLLNEGLASIGISAFEYNYALKNVKIPSTLECVPYGAFCGCDISKLTIPDNVKVLGEKAFYKQHLGYNDNDGNTIQQIGAGGVIEVGNGVSDIPIECFYHPSYLKLGENVRNIDANAIRFESPISFEKVKVICLESKTPPTVSASFPLTAEQAEQITLIVPDGSKATYQRNPRWNIFDIVEQSETDVTVYVKDAPISEEARLQSGIAPSRIVKMKVSGTLAETEWRLIRENFVSLISLDLSDISNTIMPYAALKGMTQLIELKLPAKLKYIDTDALSGCSLVDIPQIPETTEIIGDYAFSACQHLSITSLPDAVRQIGTSAFSSCTSLQSIILGSGLGDFTSDASQPVITHNPTEVFMGCTSLEFVDMSATNLTHINNNFFDGCSNLSTVILPPNLNKIGQNAFSRTAIEYISLPESVLEIGGSAFRGTRLRTVNIPEGVHCIENNTFAKCTKLLSVNFPSSITSIGTNVFTGTTKVAGISCSAIDAPSAETGALEALNYKRCSLTVPQQSYRSYLNAPQWGRLASNLSNRIVVEIPEDILVTVIDEAEYQVMVEEEQWQQEAESTIEEEEQPSAVKARKAARAAMADGSQYARLFNGAQLATPTTDKGTRVFINLKAGQTLGNVFYNDVDMTSQMEGNSLVLPGRATGNLRIVATTLTGLDDAMIEDGEPEICAAYDTLGRLVFNGERARLEDSVAPGIYIVKSGSLTEKILVK